MIDKVLSQLRDKVKQRIWIFSDLQQSIPENAKRCLETAYNDFKSLDMQCNMAWYLGDAVEGHSLEFLKEMSHMQIDTLNKLNIPIRYVLGNHDFDYYRYHKESLDRIEAPFYKAVKEVDNWKTTEDLSAFYFTEDMSDFAVVFLSDHGDYNGSWLTTHGEIHGDVSQYPYEMNAYLQLKREIEDFNKPVLTVSHYAFAGGNRPSNLLSGILPLPLNVKLHFYGHAHIGDKQWAGKDCYRKVSCVDDHNIPQVNVSSLEDRRGNAIRSVILEVYTDNSVGIYFRNHSAAKWEEYLWINLNI